MTDKDFARIKARFPAMRWRRIAGAYEVGAWALRGPYQISVTIRDNDDPASWTWTIGRRCGADDWDEPMVGWEWQTLGQCLRSLECAILREARTLAAMVGKDVTP